LKNCSRPPADCRRCPRLVALRAQVREQHPDYHAAPVAAWGRRSARLLIVGLAPGMHGANRSGRPFTGDASGDFLFAGLYRAGLVDHGQADRARLRDIRITNAVKCLPPGNRPSGAELSACRGYLAAELVELIGEKPRRNRIVLCLGTLAHDAVRRVLRETLSGCSPESLPSFSHDQCLQLARFLWLQDCYHPSRLNTSTRRLTPDMLDRVLVRTRELLGD